MVFAYEHAIMRYRHWYAKLLRFYPKPYRDRFRESMEQTFNDLCREYRAAEDGLFGFVLWVFVETSAGIVKENITFITMHNKNIIMRPALLTAGLLLIPFLGDMFGGWAWPWYAFVNIGALLFGVALACELMARNNKLGVISGFILGVIVGVLAIAVLHSLHPEEDVAGIVIITLLISGLFFAFVGYLIQNYFKKR
jgi:hypothetical protein